MQIKASRGWGRSCHAFASWGICRRDSAAAPVFARLLAVRRPVWCLRNPTSELDGSRAKAVCRFDARTYLAGRSGRCGNPGAPGWPAKDGPRWEPRGDAARLKLAPPISVPSPPHVGEIREGGAHDMQFDCARIISLVPLKPSASPSNALLRLHIPRPTRGEEHLYRSRDRAKERKRDRGSRHDCARAMIQRGDIKKHLRSAAGDDRRCCSFTVVVLMPFCGRGRPRSADAARLRFSDRRLLASMSP